MSAPDFYFAVNAIARHIHDTYGMEVLVDYWHSLGQEYYAPRAAKWQQEGPQALAEDWKGYFLNEPSAVVEVTTKDDEVVLDIRVCPAIKHLLECGREIVPYFCDHCDHTCSGMAESAGYRFERTGGMGSCQQRFVRLTHQHEEPT